jgi:septal ring factor EnvC (AmiA/AmiB activator)
MPPELAPPHHVAAASARSGASSVHDEGGVHYVLPVEAEVVDAFRPPAHRFGSGNRGWELATRGGELVRAVGHGVVAFAGQVAGSGVVSIVHPDGLRSSVTGLARVVVRTGDSVVAGAPIGVAAAGLHLGFRRNGQYVDPAVVYGVRRHAYLVPVP